MSLTNVVLRRLKPGTKTVRMVDEKGLYLEVAPSGGTWWRLKNRFDGKEKRLAPLVFVRPGELRHALWTDFDLEAGEWRYLVTKTQTPHIVPLATQAVAILKAPADHRAGPLRVPERQDSLPAHE